MSSNTNIGNTPVNQGYVQLIHMGETGGIDGTLRALYDGDGTASDLLIASNKVKIGTELFIGTKTLSLFIQDIVGAMFSSNTETNITVTYQTADNTIDLVSSGEVTLTGSETLTNKTLTSPVINTGVSGTAFLDENDMASDSATKFASQQSIKAYVDTEVAGIVSSAPSTLDTLNELAAALGDDANFSTTVTNSIATKLPLAGGQMTGNITFSSSQTVDGRDVSADGSKLDGIEASATADQSNAEIRTAVEAATDSNVFTDADHSKLNAIEASADVTNTANVTSAGALMDSEVDADIKTLSLPASTTISDAAKTLLDDDSTTNMRTTLGLEIGSDIQAYDAGLNSISGLTTAANKMIYTTGSDTYAVTALSATARTLLDDSTTANMLTTLGLTATAAELNYTDGVSSNIQTQLGTKVPTTRTITPVSSRGISGGGDLSADRTFELSQSQLATVTLNAADNLILFDNSDNDIPKRFVAQDIFDSLGGITIDGTTANGLLTYGGTNNIDTEANLTFDGNHLDITSGHLVLPYGEINDAGTDMNIVSTNALTLGTESGTALTIPNASNDVEIHDDIWCKTNLGAIRFGASKQGNIYENNDDLVFSVQSAGQDMIFENLNSAGSAYVTNLFIDGSAERVGIGTTSPAEKLHVVGNVRVHDTGYLAAGDGNDIFLRHDGNGHLQSGTGTMYINNVANTSMILSTNNTTAITISNSQHLEMGDGKELKLGGNDGLRMQGGNGNCFIDNYTGAMFFREHTDDGSILFQADNGSGGLVVYLTVDGANEAVVINEDSADIDFRVESNGNANMIFVDGGNDRVGIGNASPFAKLHISNGTAGVSALDFEDVSSCAIFVDAVQGTGKFQPLIGVGENATTFTAAISSYDAGSGAAQGLAFHTGDTNAITEAMRIESDQDVHFDQDVIAFSTTPSDIRLKKNFTKIDNGLDIVNKLEGHTFNWKKGGDRLSAGFKAQEVEKILPHLVDEKKLPLKADDDKEYKILRYEEVIPYLVEAIKEQQDQINELKGIING